MRRVSLVALLACLACTDDSETQLVAMTDAVGESRGGVGAVHGTIRFPGMIGVDRRITIALLAPTYTTSRSATVESGELVRYRIEGVPDGSYIVGAAVDVDGDEELDDEDWAGFSGGTTSAPILRRGNASQVALIDGGEGLLDVELGVVGACLLPVGETCVSDSDCRYVACACADDAATATPARTVFFLPTCQRTTRVCTLPANADCAAVCAPAPAPELSTGPCLRDLDLTSFSAD